MNSLQQAKQNEIKFECTLMKEMALLVTIRLHYACGQLVKDLHYRFISGLTVGHFRALSLQKRETFIHGSFKNFVKMMSKYLQVVNKKIKGLLNGSCEPCEICHVTICLASQTLQLLTLFKCGPTFLQFKKFAICLLHHISNSVAKNAINIVCRFKSLQICFSSL